MLNRGIIALLGAVVLLQCTIASAQWEDTNPALDTNSVSRDFAGAKVSTDFTLRAGGVLATGQRAVIQVDIDTTLAGGDLNMPRAIMINGFVTIAFPPGLEPDGQPRLKYYDPVKDRYEYLYSKSFPRLDRFAGLSGAIDATTSGNPTRMVQGLKDICAVLDPRIRVKTPTDPRLTGEDKNYAVTGLSWLIPCNVMFKELVGLFDPKTGVGRDAKLRVSLPVRVTSEVTDPNLVIYVGGLSAAVNHVNLLPEDIPGTAIPLAPIPEPVATEAPESDDAEGKDPADSKSEPRKDLSPDNEENGDSDSDQPDGEEVPPPPAEPIPVLVYSYDWQSWETELNLSAISPVTAPSAASSSSRFDSQLKPSDTFELVEEIVAVPETDSRPDRLDANPETADEDLDPVVPPMSEPVVDDATPDPEPIDTSTSTATGFQATPQESTGVRQVEPGTLPDSVESYTVALKPITGSGAGTPPSPTETTRPPSNYGQQPQPSNQTGSSNTATPPAGLGEMILVPEGYFLMGTAGGSSAGDADEEPQTQVYLDAYYIDKFPVTNRQYHNFVISAGYKPEGNWQKYYAQGTADLPVRGVTWNDAQAFARWAGKRLPTEAEWEKAARSEDGRTYPWGEDWSSEIIPRGEYLYDIMRAQTAASPYGVMGMCGLVWQWTGSAYHTYPFNPDARGDKMVLRGGAFSNGRNIIRCANRYSESANVALNTFGFRCARDA